MIDFLLKNYSLITHAVELIAALSGIMVFRKYANTPAKYFIYFLIVVAILDTLSGYTKMVKTEGFLSFLIGTKFEKNHWYTTVYWDIGSIVFFSYYFRKIINLPFFKRVVKLSTYLFVIYSVTLIIFNWNLFFEAFFSSIEIFGAIIIFLCCTFYFVELLNSDRILSFYKSLNFYIASSIFIWWLITTPLTFYDVYFAYEVENPDRDWDFIYLRWQIYLFSNIFMYLTFTFALLWCKPEND